VQRLQLFAQAFSLSDSDTISEAIVSNVTGPSRVVVAGEEVDAKNVRELIDADNHLAGKAAAAAGRSGLRFFKFVPPGGG
jgi:hypothetical protein